MVLDTLLNSIKVPNNLISTLKNLLETNMSNKLLKEAIADAKAVRETAIANAKIALEEAFTPKLQSMLSAKLQEDEMEDEELEDEMPATEEMEDEMGDEPVEDEMEMEGDEPMDGETPAEDEEEMAAEGDYSEEEEGEDLELEAIIRELEDEEEEEADEMEAEEEEAVTEEEAVGDLPPEDEDDIDLDEVIKSLSEEDEDEDEVMEMDHEKDEELEEAYNTIKSLKSTLQEVNLLNAKLLFSNRLFKSNSLSESQKMKVIETFDRASNLREVKLVYTTLAESFSSRSTKTRVTEGLASKKSNSTAPKGRIVESNDMANRMKRLAGLL